MNRSGSHSEAAAERGRWSSRRKTEVVLRIFRGEALDALSRELGVTAATLAQWRDQFLAAGQAGVRSRPTDAREEDRARLRAKIGELTMENDLLRDRAERAEAGHPFASRRSRR
ncbi:MAG TPA: transposase [Chloroflexota bacterium]|jgi:transposase-like protein